MKRGYYIVFCLLFTCIIVTAEIGYMSWEAGTCKVTAITLENGPRDIVYISDPHLHSKNIGHVREVIRKINDLEPAAVLLGGDYTYGDSDDPAMQEIWKDIDAPVYAILGNHDYRTGITGSGVKGRSAWVLEAVMRARGYTTSTLYSEYPDVAHADALERLLEQNGVTVLRNEYVELPGVGIPTLIVGLDDVWANMADPPIIPDNGAFVIYLVHEPVTRPEWDADLVIAGHTHGGQFNVAAMQAIDSLGIADISGLSYKGSVPMYVSRGIGTSHLNHGFRFMTPPEIVIINPGSSIPYSSHVVIL